MAALVASMVPRFKASIDKEIGSLEGSPGVCTAPGPSPGPCAVCSRPSPGVCGDRSEGMKVVLPSIPRERLGLGPPPAPGLDPAPELGLELFAAGDRGDVEAAAIPLVLPLPLPLPSPPPAVAVVAAPPPTLALLSIDHKRVT